MVEGKQEEILMIFLRSPKEDRLRAGVRVELFSTGTFSCPVSAWTKWKIVSRIVDCPTKPVFRLNTGTCFTGRLFNLAVKSMLGKVINYDEKKYLSHSFRAGSRVS